MKETTTAKYIPVSDAYLAFREKAPSKMTMLRDVRRGLHSIKIANRWHTTVEHLRQYLEGNSEIDRAKPFFSNTVKGRRSDAQRAKDIAVAAKALEERGI